MLRIIVRYVLAIGLGCVTYLSMSCLFIKSTPDTSELLPVFERHRLRRTDPHLARHKEVAEVEEADSALYKPTASETLFLVSTAPSEGGEELRPRYWLLVEDYPTEVLAKRRAVEYVAVGAYERAAKAQGGGDSLIASKTSLRQWAVARGRRVYALTTDASAFAFGRLPQDLKASVLALPKN